PTPSAEWAVLAACLDRLGTDLPVSERVGAYPSPTILVDGVDVMTGQPGAPPVQACRLDLPTQTRVLAALQRRPKSPTPDARTPGSPKTGRPATPTPPPKGGRHADSPRTARPTTSPPRAPNAPHQP